MFNPKTASLKSTAGLSTANMKYSNCFRITRYSGLNIIENELVMLLIQSNHIPAKFRKYSDAKKWGEFMADRRI